MIRTEPSALAAALQTALPDGAVLTGDADVERYAHDDAEWADYAVPAAVVLATSLDDVVTTVRIAGAHDAPVVPRAPAPACRAERTRQPAPSCCPSNA
ncbi:hypothetical protein C8K30_111106 [Promicromonospora sp. AC04]|uniref:hypothetical protein n=1 Tax=Promicromonospora sp. AC04 TaxID=2135723 RepID=UPI000D3F571E|nr:hypothetical protein [Promicromonospora sp. AC04]PUB23508.1 hypothetical protein C8K30_111106 [Promicromonospora sp. AC04]